MLKLLFDSYGDGFLMYIYTQNVSRHSVLRSNKDLSSFCKGIQDIQLLGELCCFKETIAFSYSFV